MGNSSKNVCTSSGLTVFCPFGLLKSEATFATNLLTEIPADAVSPTYIKILQRIS